VIAEAGILQNILLGRFPGCLFGEGGIAISKERTGVVAAILCRSATAFVVGGRRLYREEPTQASLYDVVVFHAPANSQLPPLPPPPARSVQSPIAIDQHPLINGLRHAARRRLVPFPVPVWLRTGRAGRTGPALKAPPAPTPEMAVMAAS